MALIRVIPLLALIALPHHAMAGAMPWRNSADGQFSSLISWVAWWKGYHVGREVPHWQDHAMHQICADARAERLDRTEAQRGQGLRATDMTACPDVCFRSVTCDVTEGMVANMWGIDCQTGIYWGSIAHMNHRIRMDHEKAMCADLGCGPYQSL